MSRETKPRVVIAGQDLPATLVKQGSLESVDLTLLSIDGTKLPVGLQMRRTPLCERAPYAGERVVVAIPEGTALSKVLPRQAIPADLRGRFDTRLLTSPPPAIPARACLTPPICACWGSSAARFRSSSTPLKLGAPARTTDIAKYFVPAAEIKAFIPQNVSF